MLYIVLGVIPVLGVLALVLIFWDRIPWSPKQNKVIAEAESASVKKDLDSDDEWEDGVRIVRPTTSRETASPHTRIDPALGDLGFGALDDLLAEPEDRVQVKTTAPKAATTAKRKSAVNELMILYVIAAPEQPFVGYELLQTLVTSGLRYGNLNIFHYHQQTPNGQGPSLFSLASAVEPGVFDLSNVGAIVCPGLSLFMSTQVENPVETFEIMLETAQQLAEDLNGVLCDSQRMPITETRIAEYRGKIFESSF